MEQWDIYDENKQKTGKKKAAKTEAGEKPITQTK